MTLTVRLPPPLEKSLDTYCAQNGLTKSQVVQECLAAYLAQAQALGQQAGTPAAISPAYAAFKRAGLVGAVDLGTSSATRDTVRQRAAQRLRRANP